ncbi:MAG TPA: hypothetical protein PLC48_08855 [Ferruginibacter sp.]|jgi:hypothetical protein|nr:hypothetical protein [Bacteroidales bacterium]HPH85559.1 hypothetical protein [Ferruginibacter sp.]
MATVWAIASGNVSDGAKWNTGLVPGIDDDVYADGKDMVVDLENWSIKSLRTTNRGSGTVGGTFTFPTSTYVATLTGFYSGTPYASYGAFKITASSPETIIIIGDIRNWEVTGTTCLAITGNCDVYITGNTINNGAYGSYAIYYNSTTGGNIIHSGNIIQSGGYGPAIGSQYNSLGLVILGTGNYIHTGNLSSANCEAVSVRGTGSFISTGIATSSTVMPAIYSTGTNNIYYNGILVMQTPPASQVPVIYQASSGGGCIYFKGIAENKSTTMAIYAYRMCLLSSGSTTWKFKDELGVEKNIYTADVSPLGNPPTSDVRSGVNFGPSTELTGTCHVPPASATIKGVPVDNTVGTCEVMSAAGFLAELSNSSDPLAVRLRNVATVESTGDQLAASSP